MAGTIIPRWEWRTFSPPGEVVSALARIDPHVVQDSDEVYLLTDGDANLKVRDGLLDVKSLRSTDRRGLELWEPVVKAELPVTRGELASVFAALGAPAPSLEAETYTLEGTMVELAEAGDEIDAVEVHKRRARYQVHDCMVELTDLVVDGRPGKTIAIESEDAEAVVAAIGSFGLTGYVNTNYTRGLEQVLGRRPVRYAVIDVGTNSVKFLIAERADDGWHTVLDRAEVTRLGEGLEESGEIGQGALGRTTDAIAAMVEEATTHGVVAIASVGTAGMRAATNADEAIARVQEATGILIETIPGEEEGRLAYLAVQSSLKLEPGPLVVFDSGGGSTQFTFGHGEAVLDRFSLPVGAVRYAEAFELDGIVPPSVLDQAMTALAEDLGAIDGRDQPDVVVGMGGTVTNLTAVGLAMARYDPDRIQGSALTREEVERQIELYAATPLEERRVIVGLQPKRAEVILAGACIVRTVLQKLGRDALIVSDRGLRHGLLQDRFGS